METEAVIQKNACVSFFAELHDAANTRIASGLPRSFVPLERVDEISSGAIVNTDEIIRGILNCHFFVGDLTGANAGVILETGIALALKPDGMTQE